MGWGAGLIRGGALWSKIFDSERVSSTLTLRVLALILGGFWGILGLLGSAQPVMATEAPGLQVTPTQQSIELQPGQTYTGTFEVTNLSDEATVVNFSAAPYYPADNDYNPDYETTNSWTEIAEWISFEQDGVELASGATMTATFTITVPTDVPSGGQYAALFAEAANTSGEMIETVSRVGTLILAQIGGETRTEAELLSQGFSSFNLDSDPTFYASIKNTGNADFRVFSEISITNLITRQTVYDNSETTPTASILPDTTRALTYTIPDLPKIGIFEATYNLRYLDEDHEITKILVRVPLWLVLGVVFIFVFLAVLVVGKIMQRRRRKRLELL